jgi:hypothetical protein
VQEGVEMANKPETVVVTLQSMPDYVERFGRAFPGEEDAVTFDNMAKAIEAFVDDEPAASGSGMLQGSPTSSIGGLKRLLGLRDRPVAIPVGRELAQLRDDGRHCLDDAVDLIHGVVAR